MHFEITSDDHILSLLDELQTEADERKSTFAAEQELHNVASAWPMKRLKQVWNSLPGVRPSYQFLQKIRGLWRSMC